MVDQAFYTLDIKNVPPLIVGCVQLSLRAQYLCIESLPCVSGVDRSMGNHDYHDHMLREPEMKSIT